MTAADELTAMTATELARRIRLKEISPREAVEAAIARIEARNPSLNAVVVTGFEDARREAKQAEDKVMAGEPLGPLHGVPTAIKDLFGFKPGWVCTLGGVRAMKDQVFDHHGGFAERIERAGAIILGKTNSPIMGFRGTCDNYLFGPTRNPFDLSKNSGGSSGGSAAAVADGLLPLAEGTDGGGSIRIPAACCGVFGYKPAFGRVPYVSRPNAFSGDTPFIFEGPITRTVEDAALAMSALAVYDPRDPFALDETVDFAAATKRSLKGWKIAYSGNFDVFPVDRRVRALVDKAVLAFTEAGAEVEEVTLGIKRSQQELSDLWCRLIMPGSLSALEGLKERCGDLLTERRDDFPPEFLHRVEATKGMTVLDLQRDQAIRTEIYDALQTLFADYDLLVTPTLACLPMANSDDGNTLGPSEIEGEAVDPLLGWCLTYPINFTGHPAASIPAGLCEGLPVGLQIVGQRYADGDVFAASAAFERLRPWQDSYRICAQRPL